MKLYAWVMNETSDDYGTVVGSDTLFATREDAYKDMVQDAEENIEDTRRCFANESANPPEVTDLFIDSEGRVAHFNIEEGLGGKVVEYQVLEFDWTPNGRDA